MDENVQFGQWIIHMIFFLFIPALAGAILYHIPVTRIYLRRGCLAFINAIANTHESAPNFDENESVNESQRVMSSSRITKSPRSQENDKKLSETKRHRKREYRLKKRSACKDVEKNNDEWPMIQNYPYKKIELNRDSDIELKWDKRMSRRKDDDILYPENDGPSHYDDPLLVASVDDLNNIMKNEQGENSKKRKHNGYDNEIFHYDDYIVHDTDKIKEKNRKSRKKNHLEIFNSDNSPCENKQDDEILKSIKDYLKNSSKHIENEWSRKSEIDNRNKSPELEEDDKIHESIYTESSRLNRKFPMSTKKESLIKHRRNQIDLPKSEVEGLVTDSEYYFQAPIITDRVTPIVQSAYQWVFGGCPSAKRRRRRS